MTEGDLVAAAVLSGNRNFEGRINPHVKANYLASPPLVVAYALAGTTDIDLATEPLGTGNDGEPVYLKDIWPTHAGGRTQTSTSRVLPEMFRTQYDNVFAEPTKVERASTTSEGELFEWDADEHVHPGAAVPRRPDARAAARSSRSAAPACWRRWATRSRPTTSRRPARIAQDQPRRQVS